jgi:hypothetical protein
MSSREESREDSDTKSTSKKGEKKDIKPGDQIVALWLKEDDDWRVAEVHCPALLFPVAISHCAIVCEASSKAVVWQRAHPMAGPESIFREVCSRWRAGTCGLEEETRLVWGDG